MEGVEFQIRDQSQQHQPQHPGSLDYKLVQGDSFRRSKGILESRLRSIDEAQSSIQPDLHTGQPDCSSCVSKKRQIREAFQYYYLTPEPERWDTGVPQYREQMERMIHAEDKYSLHDLQSFHDVALRDHLRNDFCTPHSTDRPENSAVRRMVADMFDNSFPLSEIISEYMKGQINASGSIDAATFLMQLQNTRDQESRATIYQHYYCNNDNSDSSAVKALKVKYGRQFGDFIPHDVVISAMREEAERSHSHGIDQLKSKVNELQMAKSASMKEQKRRAEQADQRMIDKHAETSKHAECSLPGCHVKIDLMDETIECGLCDWLASKSSSRSRAMYCSIDHAEQDFDDHDRQAHSCCMGSHCYSSLLAGPPGDVGAGGVCSSCTHRGIASYFCSQQCFDLNMNSHRDSVHYAENIESNSDHLVYFKPASDMQMIS